MNAAVDKLYNDRHIQLWVVYVDRLRRAGPAGVGGAAPRSSAIWAPTTHCWRSPPRTAPMPSWCRDGHERQRTSASTTCAATRSNPHCAATTGRGAAVAAANGLNTDDPHRRTGVRPISRRRVWRRGRRPGALLLLVAVDRRRRAQAAQSRVGRGASGSTRPIRNALAAVPLDALDDLSKSIVVDVDNAVRTSDNELALAIEEFGDERTDAVQPGRRRTRKRRWRKHSTCARSSTTPYPRPRAAARPADPRDRRGGARPTANSTPRREAFEQAARSGDQCARRGWTR